MTQIKVVQGDITKQQVDAIVNAANSSLLGGGGVDGAIHRAGGPAILEECRQIRARQGGCPTGEAVITTAGKLPAAYVIHTVGPVWQDGTQDEPAQLANCYRNSLRIASEKHLQSIAFPNISTGVYGYPKDKAAAVAVESVREYLEEHATSLQSIIFVCFDEQNFKLYGELLT
ncbi:O-acetyl-ADP-ribose deacetylase [Pontibacter sp. SGAir0037]|uniref:O-acetyl-ADP-ribose deacetylase n=1 Tax=Pontibacter sp. SGAir0037 TaxID=2571030 RepID=UPI0010CCD210|nr:O-acetyl-ADP-ribose deacetylase [Pontibacter sp. SGAir0037]QCR20995.1 O-acetyl-ADP-ribose deacetylase [Pontibacter sp. SGAir0037]